MKLGILAILVIFVILKVDGKWTEVELNNTFEALKGQNESKTLDENLSEIIKTAFLDGNSKQQKYTFSHNFFTIFFTVFLDILNANEALSENTINIDNYIIDELGQVLSKMGKSTVWKFHDFSITQILREINVGDSRCAKSAIFTH